MSEPIRIANCSGFFGDRLSAAREMVEDGPIDVLTGDWLAELTMLILARTRARHPERGYARTFVTQVEQVMGTCLDRGIKVVTNAGGLDPESCAAAVAEVAGRLGLAPTVAYVAGDDLLPRLPELRAAGALLRWGGGGAAQDGGTPGPAAGPDDPGPDPPEAGAGGPGGPDALPGDLARLVTANAYLGCWGIVEALARGADIVVTGRVTDAAVVCGPAAWHHGWARDDWDALAGAVVAGHVIECGTQATGGNYSFFAEVPGLARPGFPWAEVAADGSSVIGKHDGTGGQVSIGTVTSQLLYEIGGPAYLGPDVVARFDTVELAEVGPDRVRIAGVRGEPPTGLLKVATNELGGFRNDLVVALTGLDVEEKARLVEEGFWAACPYGPDDFASVTIALDRTDKDDPATNEEATARWRLCVKDADEAKVGRAVSGAVIEMALANVPGFHVLSGGPGGGRPFGVYRPALVPAGLVPQRVVVLGGGTIDVSSVPPATGNPGSALPGSAGPPRTEGPGDRTPGPGGPGAGPGPDAAATGVGPIAGGAGAAPGPVAPAASGGGGDEDRRAAGDPAVVRVPLGRVVGARSGDKGGDANLGVFARSDAAWAWLDGHLTVERLRELLPETAGLPVERHRLPNLRALNFVIVGLLGDGVAASTRPDGQAKSLGEWLRSRHVDVPAALLA